MVKHNKYCTNCHQTRIFSEKEDYFECCFCRKRLFKNHLCSRKKEK